MQGFCPGNNRCWLGFSDEYVERFVERFVEIYVERWCEERRKDYIFSHNLTPSHTHILTHSPTILTLYSHTLILSLSSAACSPLLCKRLSYSSSFLPPFALLPLPFFFYISSFFFLLPSSFLPSFCLFKGLIRAVNLLKRINSTPQILRDSPSPTTRPSLVLSASILTMAKWAYWAPPVVVWLHSLNASETMYAKKEINYC